LPTMSDRVHIPFCEDIEAKIVEYAEHPEMPAQPWWGWFDHPKHGKVAWTICPHCRSSSGVLVRHTISADGEV
jgi:hypothetical protein